MTNDYIHKEEVSKWLKQYGQDVLHGKYKFSLMYIWKNLMGLPSADVVEVKHGEWISECEPHYECSECHHWFHLYQFMNYCPNCGAKMDGEREE